MFDRVLKYTFDIRRSKVKLKVNFLDVPNQNSYDKNVPWQGLSHYILSFSKAIIKNTEKYLKYSLKCYKLLETQIEFLHSIFLYKGKDNI